MKHSWHFKVMTKRLKTRWERLRGMGLRPTSIEILKEHGMNRITVVERIYFEADGQEPVHVDSSYSVPVKTNEQPFSRVLKVGGTWVPLPVGWFEDGKCSLLSISNQGVRRAQGRGQPSKEEKEQMDRAVLEMVFSDNHEGMELVPPGASRRTRPLDLRELAIRCQEGECWITVTIFPE